MSPALIVMTFWLASAFGAVEYESRAVLRARTPVLDPYVEVWASDDVYRRGEHARVWFRSATDAYITVFRVDTDGRVRVLFPTTPWHQNYVAGGHPFEIWNEYRDEYGFVVDDYPGTGYLFAVASPAPFDYGAFTRGDHWDYRRIAFHGRITGDPYVSLMELIDHIVPVAAYDEYTYDVFPYHVDRRHDYPRFLCYDCHNYVTYTTWNPYRYTCVKFRVVVYDEPYYYPARLYASTRVVYVRPRVVKPRYVFTERSAREPFITKGGERPRNTVGGRRTVETSNEGVRRVERARIPARNSTATTQTRQQSDIESRRTRVEVRRTPASRAGGSPEARSVQPEPRARPKLERRVPPPERRTPAIERTRTRLETQKERTRVVRTPPARASTPRATPTTRQRPTRKATPSQTKRRVPVKRPKKPETPT